MYIMQVKSVRETMIQMIEVWKAIPDVGEEEVLTRPESQSSSKGSKIVIFIFYPLVFVYFFSVG
jgi:hypothetical protein